MRKLVLGLLGATALSIATGAGATVTLNTCTMSCTGPTVDGSETTIGFSDTGMLATFTESLSFSNDLAGLYSLTLTTSSRAVNFTSAILSDGVTSYALQKIIDDGVSEYWSFVNPPANQYAIGAGDYTLTIMGKNKSSGSMAGTVTIDQAVPEPATWAMMIIGFGAVGFSLRRKRKLGLISQIA